MSVDGVNYMTLTRSQDFLEGWGLLWSIFKYAQKMRGHILLPLLTVQT